MRRVFLAGLTLLLPAAALAAPSYYVQIQGGPYTASSTPAHADTSWSWTSGITTQEASLSGTAMAGVAIASGDFKLLDAIEYGITGGATVYSASSTDDFIITGPPGATSVSGTFKFTLNGAIGLSGGSVNNNAHAGLLQFTASAGGTGWLGQLTVGNGSSYGGYGLTGLTGDHINTIVSLPVTLPVGSAFSVGISSNWNGYAYGSYSTNPNEVTGSAYTAPNGPSLGIGDGTGLVMTLPAGYTVNSAAWNVVNNVYTPPSNLAASPGPSSHALELAIDSANPSVGSTRLRFTLPSAGVAELDVYDASGRRIRERVSGWQDAGLHSAEWDGADRIGQAATPGVYFAALRAGGRTVSRRIVRVR
jgi:hypothetical protein